MKTHLALATLCLVTSAVSAREYHVSVNGSDLQEGTAAEPLRTISAAAKVARPGDQITIHQGTYRERINPRRGGSSDKQRIVYRAAPGETVVVKGSELITGWGKVQADAWKVVVPNDFFGDFNPYADEIQGDWFNSKQRVHHTGAVYLNGHWLVEAVSREDVLVTLTPIRLRQRSMCARHCSIPTSRVLTTLRCKG